MTPQQRCVVGECRRQYNVATGAAASRRHSSGVWLANAVDNTMWQLVLQHYDATAAVCGW